MTFHSAEGARRYQETLVPLMFAPCARRLVAEAALSKGASVLDVATGTGIVARTAAAAIDAIGHVLAIDMTEGMLDAARQQPALDGAALIEYRLTTAEDALLPEGAFDAAFCQQGLQFFDEPVHALEQIRKSLKLEGRLHLALWGPLEEHPFSAAMQHALVECRLDDFTWLLEKPHRLADPTTVRGLLTQAGFNLERERSVSLLPDGRWMPEDGPRLLAASPLSTRLVGLSEEQRSQLAEAVTRALKRYARDGELSIQFAANLYSARPQVHR